MNTIPASRIDTSLSQCIFPTKMHWENVELGKSSTQKLDNVRITLAVQPCIGSHFV